MTIRNQILEFLRNPSAFGDLADDPDVWREALNDFATPGLARHKDHPLTSAQIGAWLGLAKQRAGLILGPPGTGKTHLLAWLILGYIQARRRRGMRARAFVTAFTRNAIGNVIDSVARQGARHCGDLFKTHFLGNAPSNGLDPLILHRANLGKKGAEAALEDLDQDAVVAGGSVWSLYRILGQSSAGDGFTSDLFDLVCVDEASQMVVSHGLMAMGGLREGGRLVVAGDDRQLPPIRAGREIAMGERQLGSSLYSLLKSAGLPEYALDETFRLNQPLASFPERKFYPGVYRSSKPESRLALVSHWREGLEPWEEAVLDPDYPVAVLLYEGPTAATSNPFEAKIVAGLAAKLADRLAGADGRKAEPSAFWSSNLAICSPHRAQNSTIRNLLRTDLRSNAFVETVDRIQGKERDVVLFSYTVADSEFATAEADFIFSSERLNVAITRAKTKLIVLISKSLLQAVPPDQEQVDKAEILREFIFDTTPVARLRFGADGGSAANVEVRRRGFIAESPLAVLDETQASLDEEPVLSADLSRLLEAVSRVSMRSKYSSATETDLRTALATRESLLPGLSQLHALGFIELREQRGARGRFWTARPIDARLPKLAVDYETVFKALPTVIRDSRKGTLAPLYEIVRQRFAWIDESGGDRLKPTVDRLAEEGHVVYNSVSHGLTVEWPQPEEIPDDEPLDDPPGLLDSDFEILNALESLEAGRINFGVVEGWSSTAMLAEQMDKPRSQVAESVSRLLANGWLMVAADGRIRSRMAELAREIRYVKQRFAKGDTTRRPYLVRSLKVELRDRNKPRQTEPIGEIFPPLISTTSQQYAASLQALEQALVGLWGSGARLAGFQRRSFEAITKAWQGHSDFETYVIAADTGSGKTEAAILPLISAAGGDALSGIRGTRAILAYPRIRLATNQAQRLVRYLALFSAQDGMPVLSAGLQLGGVPEDFSQLKEWDLDAGWKELGSGHFLFPFFKCPACGKDLHLHVGRGHQGLDKLACVECDFQYNGWVGSKTLLRTNPPAFFLPTTDSLHQWMQDPRAGRIFGDDTHFDPPRILVADEIHLYSHIHGAQVGYTFRRLAARVQRQPAPAQIMMIGMSATLGDPVKVWRDLIGRKKAELITPLDKEKEVNPRGREYFYFVQPEVESRGHDVAGASTSIQTIMCLSHGMRRRTGKHGGFRSLVFLDSIDKLRRLHSAFMDAEDNSLPSLRTSRYDDDPVSGAERESCCREPYGCDAFRNGECWHFAATDPSQWTARGPRRLDGPLAVARQPIHAGAKGAVEETIKNADILFATSSLEVGYDDPDITMVYQHYAPSNLASFIQRKGRGGRGSDDRPITGVTLSIYSSRDSWWFRRPRTMLEPKALHTPLNPSNYFVRRGQLVATMLDAFAIYERASGHSVSYIRPASGAFSRAEALVEAAFGPDPWSEFDAEDAREFWQRVIENMRDVERIRFTREFREQCHWIPSVLFETGDGPQLRLIADGKPVGERHDIALAMQSLAPGNGTRRYDGLEVFWRPPVEGTEPWFEAEDYHPDALASLPDAARYLPDELSSTLPGLEPLYMRPRQITLRRLGKMRGASWRSEWMIQGGAVVPAPDGAPLGLRVEHGARGSLRGFPILKTDRSKGTKVGGGLALAPWIEEMDAYIGSNTKKAVTGIAVAKVFWGADAEVRVNDPKTSPLSITQIFTVPGKKEPVLHGFHIHPEGVTFRLNNDTLDRSIDQILIDLDRDTALRRWHGSQMARYMIESRALSLGVNAYQANRAAELIFSAVISDKSRKELSALLKFWSPRDLSVVFENIRSELLSEHPLLTSDRVAEVAAAMGDKKFQPLLAQSINAVGDQVLLKRYLTSCVVHSLAIRLKEAFARASGGDPDQLMFYARLPVQFADAEKAEVTVCELASHGDGTTRSFVEHVEDFDELWQTGLIHECPNADEDLIVDRFFERQANHAAWRDVDRADNQLLSAVAADLGVRDGPMPASIQRMLFDQEIISSEVFSIYDIAMAVRDHEMSLRQTFGRFPTMWELASAVVRAASADRSSVAGRLLSAYEQVEDAVMDGSLSPTSRLSDQVLRLGMKMCVDGCRACVHQSSDLMGDSLVQSSTSRSLLGRFVCLEN
ncbi:DEAD/DEAH box helicase [Rhizobium laguerreae]|uniref:AAA domain-containing protein n=1 Tax=Rhizobium laguerreae TaxID=1076926 RepID=UPI001C904455|nr:AAA domain-containing protein [Rhizobium laguerreae]MBY3101165.1 DEAD/DEAH box helicase [Rhizobium laguerreae]